MTKRNGILIAIGGLILIPTATFLIVFRFLPDRTPASKVDKEGYTNTTSGLHVKDVELGTGAIATAGKSVTVQYTGKLLNGKQFDSSIGREPFTFTIGAGGVIPGWDEGVTGMRVGGKRKLLIPPELAYGKEGKPPTIPANSELYFEIELLKVEGEGATTTASDLLIEDDVIGQGDVALIGKTAMVHYTGKLADGTTFDSSINKDPFSFKIGAGKVIKGWDLGLVGMKVGGKRRLIIPAELGYGPNGQGVIPANAKLYFEIELIKVY